MNENQQVKKKKRKKKFKWLNLKHLQQLS